MFFLGMGNCTLAFPGPRTPVEFGIVIYLTLSLQTGWPGEERRWPLAEPWRNFQSPGALIVGKNVGLKVEGCVGV